VSADTSAHDPGTSARRRGGRRLVSLERRAEVAPWVYVAVPVIAVLLALMAGAVFLLLTGHDPLTVYPVMVRASFASTFGFADTLVSATPLILTGLAALVSFRVKLWNIGAEGQLYIGAVFASGAALAIGEALPTSLNVAVMVVAGAAGGMVFVAVPAMARAWLRTNEIITTLLLNSVALLFINWLIFGSQSFWRDPAAGQFPQGLRIPVAANFPRFGTTRVHLGLVVALLAVVAVWLVLRATRFGYRMRVLGDSEEAARYAGIPVRGTVVMVLLFSGALAGIAGATEVGGLSRRLDPNSLAIGLGYAGIIVAALARLNPGGVVLVAVMLGGVRNAGTALQSLPDRVPMEIAVMLEGAILLFALGSEVLVRYRIRWPWSRGPLVEVREGPEPSPAPAAARPRPEGAPTPRAAEGGEAP
jgi:general nucleoside transport system permease protein